MTDADALPAWLTEAKKRLVTPSGGAESDAAWLKAPIAGEIRKVLDLESQPLEALAELGGGRYALVLEHEVGRANVLATLLTNELEMATDRDVLIHPESDQLPVDLLAEPDLSCDFLIHQFGPAIARIDSESLAYVLAATSGHYAEVPWSRRGMPLVATTDPRWVFKEEELEELQGLGRECFRLEMEGRLEHCRIVHGSVLDRVDEAPKSEPATLDRLLQASDFVQGGIADNVILEQLAYLVEDPTARPDLVDALAPLLEAAMRGRQVPLDTPGDAGEGPFRRLVSAVLTEARRESCGTCDLLASEQVILNLDAASGRKVLLAPRVLLRNEDAVGPDYLCCYRS